MARKTKNNQKSGSKGAWYSSVIVSWYESLIETCDSESKPCFYSVAKDSGRPHITVITVEPGSNETCL